MTADGERLFYAHAGWRLPAEPSVGTLARLQHVLAGCPHVRTLHGLTVSADGVALVIAAEDPLHAYERLAFTVRDAFLAAEVWPVPGRDGGDPVHLSVDPDPDADPTALAELERANRRRMEGWP